LRIIVVYVATVKKSDGPGKTVLTLLQTFIYAYEFSFAVFRKCPSFVNAEDSVHKSGDRFVCNDFIHDSCKRSSHRSHKICVGKSPVTKRAAELAVFQFGRRNQVSHLDSGRTGHFATLAVKAVFKGIIKEYRTFQPVPFPVRPGLLGAWIFRIDHLHRADGFADGAFLALLEIEQA